MKNCYIEIVLDAPYSTHAIQTILEYGHREGFEYLDYYSDLRNKHDKVIQPKDATEIIIRASVTNDIPGIFTILEPEARKFLTDDVPAYSTLFFHKGERGNLIFRTGSIEGCFKKRYNLIDFNFYVHLFINLCKEFQILEVETACQQEWYL